MPNQQINQELPKSVLAQKDSILSRFKFLTIESSEPQSKLNACYKIASEIFGENNWFGVSKSTQKQFGGNALNQSAYLIAQLITNEVETNKTDPKHFNLWVKERSLPPPTKVSPEPIAAIQANSSITLNTDSLKVPLPPTTILPGYKETYTTGVLTENSAFSRIDYTDISQNEIPSRAGRKSSSGSHQGAKATDSTNSNNSYKQRDNSDLSNTVSIKAPLTDPFSKVVLVMEGGTVVDVQKKDGVYYSSFSLAGNMRPTELPPEQVAQSNLKHKCMRVQGSDIYAIPSKDGGWEYHLDSPKGKTLKVGKAVEATEDFAKSIEVRKNLLSSKDKLFIDYNEGKFFIKLGFGNKPGLETIPGKLLTALPNNNIDPTNIVAAIEVDLWGKRKTILVTSGKNSEIECKLL